MTCPAASRTWLRSIASLALAVLVVSLDGVTRVAEAAPRTGWQGFGVGQWPGASWRPYAPTSPFNRPLGRGDAVHPRSRAMVERISRWGPPGNLLAGVSGTREDYGHPVYFAAPDDPMFRLRPTRSWGRNKLRGKRIRIPDGARPAGGSDGHMTVITPGGWEYDFWQVERKPRGGGTLSFGWGGRLRVDGHGLRGGATAAEFGNLAGMIRAAELRAGRIDHALFLVLRCTSNRRSFGHGVRRRKRGDEGSSFVFPASKGGSRCGGESDVDVPPMGARFRLRMSDGEIAALRVPGWKKTILRALAEYGAFVGDTGGPGFGLMFESGASYTSFGREDPMVTFAREQGLPRWKGSYVFNLADGVDWENRLQVMAPPRRLGR